MKLDCVIPQPRDYMPEPQWLTVLHAVTFCRLLVINDLRCYINDNGGSAQKALPAVRLAIPLTHLFLGTFFARFAAHSL